MDDSNLCGYRRGHRRKKLDEAEALAEEYYAAFRHYLGKDEDVDEDEPHPPSGFGKYSFEFVMQTCANFEAHGILPFPGAWVDQPQSWVDALYQWRAWLRYVQRQEGADEPRKGKDIFDEMTNEGESLSDWRSLIGE